MTAITVRVPESVEVTITPLPSGYRVECEYWYGRTIETERRFAHSKKYAERLARQFLGAAEQNGSPCPYCGGSTATCEAAARACCPDCSNPAHSGSTGAPQ